MEKRLETKQMKLTKQTLKRIIKEELEAVMAESTFPDPELEQDLMDGVMTLPYEGYLEEQADTYVVTDRPYDEFEVLAWDYGYRTPEDQEKVKAMWSKAMSDHDRKPKPGSMDEGMSPDHPDYDMLGGIISRVLMAVLMRGADIESAMDGERVPEEHRDYVRQRVMAMSGR